MRMNATENKANFRANEPSVMIGRFQPRFHKVKLEWNDRETIVKRERGRDLLKIVQSVV